MVIRETPKDKSKYKIINNTDIIRELALIGIFPKYMDGFNSYFEPIDKLIKYLEVREQEQWTN